MNVYKNYLVVYGGQTRDMKNTVDSKKKHVRAEVFLFDLYEKQWTELVPDNPDHDSQARRLHCSAIVGTILITCGGVDKSNKHINNLMRFNLLKPHWEKL